MEEKEEEVILFKIITLGESGVGKTSFIKKYVHNTFDLEKFIHYWNKFFI